jgi:hypothetical protein
MGGYQARRSLRRLKAVNIGEYWPDGLHDIRTDCMT